MRKFVIGTLIGAGLMYWYLGRAASWFEDAKGKRDTLGAEFRGDSHRRSADEALR